MNYNVFFGYKKSEIIFNNVNFDIQENKVTVICGHNGAGKTTLLKLISGILPSSMEIFPAWYVSANGGLIKHFSLKEHLKIIDKNARKNPLVDAAYGFFEAEAFENKKISDLSSGQVMMASIIVALCSENKILLLDEPFAPLDPANAEKFCKLLKLACQNGKTLVVTSHDLFFTSEIYDSIYFIKNGNVFWKVLDSEKRFSAEELRDLYSRYA